jgi:hypothetical protein
MIQAATPITQDIRNAANAAQAYPQEPPKIVILITTSRDVTHGTAKDGLRSCIFKR